MMSRKILLSLFVIFMFSFLLGEGYKFLVFFRPARITKNPVFKWIKENKLSDEMEKMEILFRLLGDVNPSLKGCLVSVSGGSYLIFEGDLKKSSLIKKINESPNFFLIGFDKRRVKIRFGRNFYFFELNGDFSLFYKEGFKNFVFKKTPAFCREVGAKDLVVIIPPEMFVKMFKLTENGNFFRVLSSWEYVAIFPVKYNPLVVTILIKNKDFSSLKDTTDFFNVIKNILSDFLKNNHFKDFKLSFSNRLLFTRIVLSFGN